jgi:hypothetical protein
MGTIVNIMATCIIFHNMIIENGSDVGFEILFELNNVPCSKRKLN